MTSRSRRTVKPPLRYGFDDSNSDVEEHDLDNSSASSSLSSSSDSNSESDHECSNAEQAWTFVDINSDHHVDLDFDGNSGYRNNLDVSAFNISDYVDLYLPRQLFIKLCDWCNARAIIAQAAAFLGEYDLQWTPVTVDEMRCFIGLTFATGIIRKPSVKSYWSTEPLMSTPYFGKCMSRDRYSAILRFIRFSDPYMTSKIDRNSHIKQLDQEMLHICSTYVPEHRLSLDESLLLHKGRLQFKLFIASKRSRFGIKIFMLCDRFGYMICCEVYYGAESPATYQQHGADDLLKSEKIVVHLLMKGNLLDHGYTVTLDNWYCSVKLAKFLWSRKTAIRGTIRPNRGIPLKLRSKVLSKYQAAYIRNGEVLAVKFFDKKEIYVITTADSAGETEKTRILKDQQEVSYKKPTAIEIYNTDMGGVDLTDQLLAGTTCVRKCHLWFKKIGLHYIQRLLLNSYLRYKCDKALQYSFVDYIKTAIVCLTQVESDSIRGRQLHHKYVPRNNNNLHTPVLIPTAEGNMKPRRKCKICTKNAARKDTYYCCLECPGQPSLCVGPCFREWHEQVQ